jgi:hypothetical protein
MNDFGAMDFGWLIVPILEFFGSLVVNIIVIAIGSIGFKETKGKGWLFFMIYGLVGIISGLPSVFYIVVMRFMPSFAYSRIMVMYTIIGFLFRLGSAALLIVGLMFLLKDYRALKDGTATGS